MLPPFNDTWAAMEFLLDQGLVRSIGLSNFSPEKMQNLLTTACMRPAVNQVCGGIGAIWTRSCCILHGHRRVCESCICNSLLEEEDTCSIVGGCLNHRNGSHWLACLIATETSAWPVPRGRLPSEPPGESAAQNMHVHSGFQRMLQCGHVQSKDNKQRKFTL